MLCHIIFQNVSLAKIVSLRMGQKHISCQRNFQRMSLAKVVSLRMGQKQILCDRKLPNTSLINIVSFGEGLRRIHFETTSLVSGVSLMRGRTSVLRHDFFFRRCLLRVVSYLKGSEKMRCATEVISKRIFGRIRFSEQGAGHYFAPLIFL